MRNLRGSSVARKAMLIHTGGMVGPKSDRGSNLGHTDTETDTSGPWTG